MYIEFFPFPFFRFEWEALVVQKSCLICCFFGVILVLLKKDQSEGYGNYFFWMYNCWWGVWAYLDTKARALPLSSSEILSSTCHDVSRFHSTLEFRTFWVLTEVALWKVAYLCSFEPRIRWAIQNWRFPVLSADYRQITDFFKIVGF